MNQLVDVKCIACRRISRDLFIACAPGHGPNLRHERCPLCGVMALERVWLKAPGMRPDIQPYFDDQLGAQVNSRAHRDDILRERGLAAISKEEFTKRAEDNSRIDAEPAFPSEQFKEIAIQAYHDLKAGRAPMLDRPLLTPEQVADGELPPVAGAR